MAEHKTPEVSQVANPQESEKNKKNTRFNTVRRALLPVVLSAAGVAGAFGVNEAVNAFVDYNLERGNIVLGNDPSAAWTPDILQDQIAGYGSGEAIDINKLKDVYLNFAFKKVDNGGTPWTAEISTTPQVFKVEDFRGTAVVKKTLDPSTGLYTEETDPAYGGQVLFWRDPYSKQDTEVDNKFHSLSIEEINSEIHNQSLPSDDLTTEYVQNWIKNYGSTRLMPDQVKVEYVTPVFGREFRPNYDDSYGNKDANGVILNYDLSWDNKGQGIDYGGHRYAGDVWYELVDQSGNPVDPSGNPVDSSTNGYYAPGFNVHFSNGGVEAQFPTSK